MKLKMTISAALIMGVLPVFAMTNKTEMPVGTTSETKAESVSERSPVQTVTYELRWSEYQKKYVVDFTNRNRRKVKVDYYWYDGEDWRPYSLKINANSTDTDNPAGPYGYVDDVSWDFAD